MDKISKKLWINRDDLLSTENLLYTYNNRLTEIKQSRQEIISRNTRQIQSSESTSSFSKQNQDRNWQKRTGSSRSNSSTSGSEEFQNFEILAYLNKALKSMTSLSLAFQDNQKLLNAVQKAQEQAREMVDKFQQSSNMEKLETLEMFTNFVNLLREMNDMQIAEVEQGILNNGSHNLQSEENTFVKNDAWNILRDGIAQAGTGPALLTIIKWIENGKLNGTEAAHVISKIPKVVRIPSKDYIEAVFVSI